MPKLIIVNRRLGVVNRHLVTDAGGAPCCCGGGGICECDPSLRLAPMRSATCADNVPTTVASLPARIAVVRLEWAMQFESLSVGGGVRFAQRGTSNGRAVWCVTNSQVGTNQLVWSLATAESGYVYQSAGTNVESFTEEVTLGGSDALIVPAPSPVRRYALAWSTAGKHVIAWYSPRAFTPRFIQYQNRCIWSDTYGPEDGVSEREQWAFAGDTTGGATAWSYEYADPNLTNTSTSRAVWTVEYLTCDGSGPSELEGGCSNCGDRSQLEAL